MQISPHHPLGGAWDDNFHVVLLRGGAGSSSSSNVCSNGSVKHVNELAWFLFVSTCCFVASVRLDITCVQLKQ